MRTRKINVKNFLIPEFTIMYGGQSMGKVKDIKILENKEELRKIMISVAFKHMKALLGQTFSRMNKDIKGHQRNLEKGNVTLLEAYQSAMTHSSVTQNESGVSLSFLDMGILDRLLPRSKNSAGQDKGGWWRIHEVGSASKVGASSEYGFVSSEHLNKVLNKYGGLGGDMSFGRHGEGIMVRIGSGFGNRLGVKIPFGGVKPMRLILSMQNNFRKDIQAMRTNIVSDVAIAIARGLTK